MIAHNRINELIERIYDGSETTVEVEYMGKYIVNGPYTLRLPEGGLGQQWRQSVVPFDYFPLYGLKIDQPEAAGGLFDAAPFARFDRNDIQNQHLNLPAEPEVIYELGTDNVGAQFWVGDSLTVYGHNLNNEFQAVGTLGKFVDFAVRAALERRCWHQCLQDTVILAQCNLRPIDMMG